MNAFFAAVEQAHRPHLRGKPILISADPYGTPKGRRSVVATASYEARPYGITAGMPLFTALTLCPSAVIVEGNAGKYAGIAREFMRIFSCYTDAVEPYSIDEAFLDLTHSAHLFGGKHAVAHAIKDTVRHRFGITCSVGIAPNKLLAKMASNLKKPDGLVVWEPWDVPECIWGMPVDAIPGIGRRRRVRLALLGITTIRELALAPRENLWRALGVVGEYLQNAAWGLDDSPVVPADDTPTPKSVSNSSTFGRDTDSLAEVSACLMYLTDKAVTRMRRHRRRTRTVGVAIRYADFGFDATQRRFGQALDRLRPIYGEARTMLEGFHPFKQPVRLVGVFLSDLEPAVPLQYTLIPEINRELDVETVLFSVRERFGHNAVLRASALPGKALVLE